MYTSLATILCRFDLQLFETYRERDVDYSRDYFLREADPSSPGIRVKVVGDNGRLAA